MSEASMSTEICPDYVVQLGSSLQEAAGTKPPGVTGEQGRAVLAAARDGNVPAVLDLMAAGAPFTLDWLGTSALHLAAANGHADMCGVLLRAGLSRETRTKTFRTPLHMAAYNGHYDTVRLLLAAGADHSACDMLGMTPLHWASEKGHASCVRALLGAGADPHAMSHLRTTPRSIAHPDLLDIWDKLAEGEEQSLPPEQIVELNSVGQDALPPEGEAEGAGEDPLGGESRAAGEGAAAELLRAHGIALLPHDPHSTLLAAMNSGRTVLLSDAGKLVLQESSSLALNPKDLEPSAPKTEPSPRKRKAHSDITIRKVMGDDQTPVKYVALPSKSTANVTNAKSTVTTVNTSAVPTTVTSSVTVPGTSLPRITMAKVPMDKVPPQDKSNGAVVRVPAKFLSSNCVDYLRGQLLAAHVALGATRAQLAKAKASNARLQRQLDQLGHSADPNS